MSYGRLIVCVLGVYTMFLIWGIAQERLATPFSSNGHTEKWRFAFVMGALQSFFSVIASAVYIAIRRKKGQSMLNALGLSSPVLSYDVKQNGSAKSMTHTSKPTANKRTVGQLLASFAYLSAIATSAAPFGFASLSHISYPAMVLGKSCKLIPVMLMNVILYRRRFALHKYVVVALVTTGITLFMVAGDQAGSSKHKSKSNALKGGSSMIGLLYLLINLLLDGVLNSTQDELIGKYQINGQQMMFFMNIFGCLLNLFLSLLPLPYVPVLHPSDNPTPELFDAWAFIARYPSAWTALLQFAFTGSIGQLFIFETLAHFGSLTLVTITLTRKLFTMLLSVVVYRHKLSPGQYAGAATVFLGISVEWWVKRSSIKQKMPKVVKEEAKAKLKEL